MFPLSNLTPSRLSELCFIFSDGADFVEIDCEKHKADLGNQLGWFAEIIKLTWAQKK